MEVHFTPEQEAFVRTAIESGRLQSAEDAVQQALVLWENVNATARRRFLLLMNPRLTWSLANMTTIPMKLFDVLGG